MNTPTGKLGQYLTTAFDPRTIPGCTLWLDAADRNTITLSGTSVTAWIDKSSNGYSFTGVSNPQSGTATINGLNAIDVFTNSNAYFSNTSISFSTPFSVFGVGIIKAFTGVEQAFLGAPTDAVFSLQFQSTTPQINIFTRNATLTGWAFNSAYVTQATISNANVLFGTTVSSGALPGAFVNGSQLSLFESSNTGSYTITGLQIARRTTLANSWNGHIGEVLIYSSALTTTQRQQLEGYLAAKWGLTSSLPATHPFKSLPPISRQFAPVDISGCVLWIDAADASTVTLSGNNITQLQDKSSNAYVFATASGFTYNVTKFNGTYPSFYSPTSTAGYSLGSNASFTLNQPFTAFAVGGNLITPASGGYFWDSTSNANRAALLSFSPGRPTMFAGVELFSVNSNSFTGALILTCQYNSTSSSIFENGSNTSSNTNVGTQNAVSLRLGAAWSSTTNWNGHICEILFFNRLMSTAERQQVEGYLANKWGLRGNLASTHPFKLYSTLTPVFTPVQISGCQLWLDGIDPNGNSIVPSNGTVITSWVDKSGNGNSLSNVGNGVTYATATSNISYDGTSYLQRTSMTISSTFTLFAVARKTSGGGPLFTNLQTTDVTGFFPRYTDGGLYITRGDSPPNWGFSANSFADGTTNLYSITYDTGSNINLWANGSLWLTTTQTGGITRNSMVLGKRNVGGTAENWTGTFSEILHYNTTPSTSQRQQIEGYLAHKWGLTGSLPATHPYKKFRN